MGEGFDWPSLSLEQLERDVWGKPDYDSYLVSTCHRLRNKPLREFTVEDLRIMLGQQISLPILMPMAIEVLEQKPFAAGDYYRGDLLNNALRVDPKFWKKHPKLWHRIDTIACEVDQLVRMSQELLIPAWKEFQKAYPSDE